MNPTVAADNLAACPVCGRDILTGESVDIIGLTAEQDVSCDQCGATWTDVYVLADRKLIRDGEGIRYR